MDVYTINFISRKYSLFLLLFCLVYFQKAVAQETIAPSFTASTSPIVAELVHAAANLPVQLNKGQFGIVSNTWIPVNISFQGKNVPLEVVEITLQLTHIDLEKVEIYLHPPKAMQEALEVSGGILLAANGDVEASNIFTLTFLEGTASDLASSEQAVYVAIQNQAINNIPVHYGKTWYIQMVDNDWSDATNAPTQSGEIQAASIALSYLK